MKVNKFHKTVLQDYADGDFAYLAALDEIPNPHALGDSLLTFLLIQLSEEEDCESLECGIRRIETGHEDLSVALLAMRKLQFEIIQRLNEEADALC